MVLGPYVAAGILVYMWVFCARVSYLELCVSVDERLFIVESTTLLLGLDFKCNFVLEYNTTYFSYYLCVLVLLFLTGFVKPCTDYMVINMINIL